MLITYMIGAVAAYGSNLLALPLLLFIIQDVDIVVAVLLITGTVQSGHLALVNRTFLNTRKMLLILAVCLVGTPVGFYASGVLPEKKLMLAMGIVLIISGAIPLLWAIIIRMPRIVCYILLIFGGMIHGAFGAGGGPIVLAVRSMIPNKLEFRATLFFFWTVINFMMAASRGMAGRMDSYVLLLSLLALPVLFLGNYMGQYIAVKLSNAAFDRLVGLVLILAGVITIYQSIN
ncbi:MAG: TSUP family transporter [Desulfonatronovibrio sp.]